MPKELCVTTDFIDDLMSAGRHFTAADLDAMMHCAASLGATRYEWILDTVWALYDAPSPVGFDLLATACEAAHRHGLRFDVVFKPYEGALSNASSLLPDTAPCPDKAPVLKERTGLIHAVRPFVLEHPEMCVSRRADEAVDPGGAIAAIRLVKNDDQPAPFGLDQLSIWTSRRNGGFTRYNGPVSLCETREWRPTFPHSDRPCRILTLAGLALPEDCSFIRIRCEGTSDRGDFTNNIGRLVELVNADNEVIPSMPSSTRIRPDAVRDRLERIECLKTTRYVNQLAVSEQLLQPGWLEEQCEGMYLFQPENKDAALEQIGEIALMRGKPSHLWGVLHPIYPEVRQNWLDHIRFCIERGVDGVNIRVANHNHMGSFEQECYGFNSRVLDTVVHSENTAEVSRANGQAHTQFLREAKELLHKHGRELGVHVHALMLRHDDRNPENKRLPSNFDWQWDVWVREIADYVEFRGAFMLRPEHTRAVTDRIGLAAREAGIPLIFQSNRGSSAMHFTGPHPCLAAEMDWLRSHPDVAAYNLYETAGFTRIKNNQFELSRDITELVRTHWW